MAAKKDRYHGCMTINPVKNQGREQSQLLLDFINPTQYIKLLCAAIESYGSIYADLQLLSDAGL